MCCASLELLPMSVLTKPVPTEMLLRALVIISPTMFCFHAGDDMVLAAGECVECPAHLMTVYGKKQGKRKKGRKGKVCEQRSPTSNKEMELQWF